jgi:hypothetical protein
MTQIVRASSFVRHPECCEMLASVLSDWPELG